MCVYKIICVNLYFKRQSAYDIINSGLVNNYINSNARGIAHSFMRKNCQPRIILRTLIILFGMEKGRKHQDNDSCHSITSYRATAALISVNGETYGPKENIETGGRVNDGKLLSAMKKATKRAFGLLYLENRQFLGCL